MTTEIADWMSAQTLHPRLVIETNDPDAALAALSHQLEQEGFKVADGARDRVRLRYYDWLAIASGMWARTDVVLTTSEGAVTVEVSRGPKNRGGRNKGRRALNAAVRSLRESGVDLTVGPWHKAS